MLHALVLRFRGSCRNFTGSAACMRAVAQFFQSLLSKANALTSPTDPLSISAVRSLVVEIADVLTQAAGTGLMALGSTIVVDDPGMYSSRCSVHRKQCVRSRVETNR